ncbi:MAG TPA: 6-phosphofructokinase [Bacilli bacterium]|nr:6-phosphofructokinase [Bacilli bacterium]HPS19236.1 6-phosphofructokinase [Bacilli bacterium]
MVKKLAILTSGGDAPGMNAAIRVCIRAGLYYGIDMYVVYEGFKGLIEGNIKQINKEFTSDIMNRGGTIIRSARLEEFKEPAVVQKAVRILKDFEIDGLIGIGGDGTYRGLADMARLGYPVVGIPGTIDNDVASTDETIGFATALNTICECVDKIKDTSGSHQRCSVIEVMGRHCGDLAIFSSLAEGAEACITFDHPTDEEDLFRRLRKMKAQNKSHAIVIVSENLLNIEELAKKIEQQTGFSSRTEVLGRLQRGGTPVAHDRILAARLGTEAVELFRRGEYGKVVGIHHNTVVSVDLEKALEMKRDIHSNLMKLVEMLQ